MSDNFAAPVSAGTTFAAKDFLGLKVPVNILADASGNDVLGLAADLPDPHTLLGRLKAVSDALAGALTASPVGQTYTDRSVTALTGNQATGTDPVLLANGTRKALMINPPADCLLLIGSGAAIGYPLFGGVPNAISGVECPTNAIYLSGLAAAQAVAIWEA